MRYHYIGMCFREAATITATLILVSVMIAGTAQTAVAADSNCAESLPALTGGTQHCQSQGSGNLSNSWSWNIWMSGSGGCITTYNKECAFKATWNGSSGDFLARTGYQWNSTKTHSQIGTLTADYSFTKTGTGGGYSYIGIYGWTKNPLIEFYIVDDWYTKPNPGGSNMGKFTVDGDEYTVYKHQQVNQPSIIGNTTFDQFFSVRKTARQCGHISLSEHFKEWEKLGMKLGNMYEARILVEAGGGSGSIDFRQASLDINKVVSVLPEPASGRHETSISNLKGSGVLSLISLKGTVLKSVRQDGSKQAIIPTGNLAKGVYFMQFKGEGKAPVTRSLIVK